MTRLTAQQLQQMLNHVEVLRAQGPAAAAAAAEDTSEGQEGQEGQEEEGEEGHQEGMMAGDSLIFGQMVSSLTWKRGALCRSRLKEGSMWPAMYES